MKDLVLKLADTQKREILIALVQDDKRLTPGQRMVILAELPESNTMPDKSKDESKESTDADIQADIARLGGF